MKRAPYLFILFSLLISGILTAQDNSGFKITCSPLLQYMSTNSVSVYWEVNREAKSWIEYGVDEKIQLRARNVKHGMVDVKNGMQNVKLSGLQPGTVYYYRAVSCEVKSIEPYKVTYGDTLKSKIFRFKTPGLKEDEFSFLVFNDLHNAPEYLEETAKSEGEFDFVLFNGDILTDINDEKEFAKKIFAPVSTYFASEKPVYFIRGNHETRGAAARALENYIETPEGHFYYTFKRGNTFFIILDCGEDKPDSNKYYFGLAEYDNYRSIQAEWLKKVVASKEFLNSRHRIVCVHMPLMPDPGKDNEPGHGIYDLSRKMSPILGKAKIDLMLSGHTHKYEIIRPAKGKFNFPVVIGGAYYDVKRPERAAYTRVEISKKGISAQLKNVKGEMLEKAEIKK